ncbi:MAG: hypothetical protein A3I44_01940 [Candidatus Sungbacteria bacterium RIFCSPLOWO2_02_FULL_51_17]|nr:MAG: hypothetical protein A2676_04080 [Candidatus Sungbacteria bacterium RIFCSPHIGHO2_01_FULL_51_22]OHA07845.1 MAG: hypothetical protein A3B29_00725 [Candidatus Sungbacteria bacterium RIFCSPLOWO2_01_FULL_51_34]OHA11421.1 MAG: hypothetical protein A3I44_01940 [Candidatus Sungbacteria bacterium RIFCSPLOWO2_02_FULL_51_17]
MKEKPVMRKIAMLFSAIFAVVVLINSASFAQTVEVPDIEQWKETIYPFGDANMGHPTRTPVTWHKDPQGNDFEGSVTYYVDSAGNKIALLKSWNFQNYGSGSFDWSQVRVSLLLDNGSWYTGKPGEMLRIKRGYNKQGEVIAITYQFTGNSASVSRTINFQ